MVEVEQLHQEEVLVSDCSHCQEVELQHEQELQDGVEALQDVERPAEAALEEPWLVQEAET